MLDQKKPSVGIGGDGTGQMEILWVGRRGKGKERSEENRGCACENEREVKKGEEARTCISGDKDLYWCAYTSDLVVMESNGRKGDERGKSGVEHLLQQPHQYRPCS